MRGNQLPCEVLQQVDEVVLSLFELHDQLGAAVQVEGCGAHDAVQLTVLLIHRFVAVEEES